MTVATPHRIDTRIETSASPPETMSRRDQIAVAVFATWMTVGLFVDGWAHNAEKPEDFWTPWHALLYSGFVAAMLWFGREGFRSGRGAVDAIRGSDALTAVGVISFATAGVADMVWHEIFGVEEDIEALLSPSHLMLMIGGIFMATGAVRATFADGATRPSMRSFAPTLVALTVATAIVAFFLQFASPFTPEREFFAAGASEEMQALGVAAVLLTTVVFVVPVLLLLRRMTPPPGTFTVLFTAVALLMSGLDAFDFVALVGAGFLAGVTADALTARLAPGTGRPRAAWAVAGAVSAVLWAAWFALYALTQPFAWTVELWGGSIVLSALGGMALALLAFPPGQRLDVETVTPFR